MFPLRRFSFFFPHRFHCLKPSYISQLCWHTHSSRLQRQSPAPQSMWGTYLQKQSWLCCTEGDHCCWLQGEAVPCSQEAGSMPLCIFLLAPTLGCQAGWNTQPHAQAGQGRNLQGFPHLGVEAAHTQNGDFLSAKGLYPTLSPGTGLDCAQPPCCPGVNFESCSSRHEIICSMVLFCFPLTLQLFCGPVCFACYYNHTVCYEHSINASVILRWGVKKESLGFCLFGA